MEICIYIIHIINNNIQIERYSSQFINIKFMNWSILITIMIRYIIRQILLLNSAGKKCARIGYMLSSVGYEYVLTTIEFIFGSSQRHANYLFIIVIISFTMRKTIWIQFSQLIIIESKTMYQIFMGAFDSLMWIPNCEHWKCAKWQITINSQHQPPQ